jgi:hypothetical protein
MDPDQKVLMVVPWNEMGCEVCRRKWETAHQPPQIAVNVALHAWLHRCEVCGAFWEQNERYATVISEAEARKNYPEAFE